MSFLKVRFRQSGGFAGLVRGHEISAADASAEELARMLKESGLAEHTAAGGSRTPPTASDGVQYDLEIDTSAGTKHVVLSDADLNDRTKPLIRFLQERAKPMKP